MSFDHVAWRPLPYSMGVAIGSDWQDKPADDPVFGLYTTCGLWTRAEADLLHAIAMQFPGEWLEIGAHTGFCTEKIADANWTHPTHSEGTVTAIEPMFGLREWYERFVENVDDGKIRGPWNSGKIMPWAGLSSQFFVVNKNRPEHQRQTFDACLIDGDHEGGQPWRDAVNCYEVLNERGVIILHDFRGGPVYDAAKYLVDQGMNWRVYPSVNMVFVAWRGEFSPPPDIQEGETDWAKHYGLPEWAR